MRKVNNHHKSKTEQIKMLRETNIESHSFSLILILNHIGYAVINILRYRHTHTHTAKKTQILLLYYRDNKIRKKNCLPKRKINQIRLEMKIVVYRFYIGW